MTKACTVCLPPYAGWLTSNERINYSHFAAAIRMGYVPLAQETIRNKEVVRWACKCFICLCCSFTILFICVFLNLHVFPVYICVLSIT